MAIYEVNMQVLSRIKFTNLLILKGKI